MWRLIAIWFMFFVPLIFTYLVSLKILITCRLILSHFFTFSNPRAHQSSPSQKYFRMSCFKVRRIVLCTVDSGNSELGFVTNFVYKWEMFTIQHVVYVIKNHPVSPKMFTNERLFTIQAFTITRVHCISFVLLNFIITKFFSLLQDSQMHFPNSNFSII